MNTKKTYIFILTILLIFILGYLKLFDALNHKIFDNYIIFDQQKVNNNRIVIVEIDNLSLKTLGQWPWKRSYMARALEEIEKCHPAVIGVEVAYTVKTAPKEDNALYKALKNSKNVVLVREYKHDKNILVPMPIPGTFKGIDEGHLLLTDSQESVIRTIPVYPVVTSKHDKTPVMAFSLEILKKYLNTDIDKTETEINALQKLFKKINRFKNNKKAKLIIDYKRSPREFQKVTFLNVLDGHYSPEVFKDKIVLIGITSHSNAKIYPTPFTGKNSISSASVELQAQIIDSLLSFRDLKECPEWLVYILSILFVVGVMLLLKDKIILIQGIIYLGSIIVIVVADYIAYHYFAILFLPALPLVLVTCITGLSLFFTTSSIDSQLTKTISKYQQDKNVPLLEIPNELDGKLNTFATLMDIINTDRQTIKAIINGVNNGILVFDRGGNIIWANDRVLNIYENNLVLNENVTTLIPEFNITEIIDEINQTGLHKIDIRYGQKDYLCIINPITDTTNQYIVIFNDVTELKELDRLKTNMVRMVSHELKSPLMVIQICSENIEILEDKPKINEQNEKIFNASTLMMDTITNFLNLNKLESNLMETTFEPLDVDKLIKMSLSLQTTLAEQKNLTIEVDKEDVPAILADKNLLNIVLNNLISNAIKYSHEGNKITLKIEQDEDFVYTSVRDYGLGMSEEDCARVFDKFFRSKENKKYKIKGTGLGLSIVQKIVQVHNGSISATSKLNEGSCFRFSIPKVK